MNEHQRAEEQEVRDLIAGAGPRPVVPAEDVARIQRAARAEWAQMVAGERRLRARRVRRGVALAAGILLAVALGWWWAGRTAPVVGRVVARVELVAGTVRTGEAAELAVGDDLTAGAWVETAGWAEGASAGAALRLDGGQSLRLAADTRVRLAAPGRLELERGTLYVDADPARAAAGIEVVTSLGTVREVGTQFEVRLSEGESALRVRVREGECELEAAGDSHLAVRGEQLSLLADGVVTRATVEPYSPEWDWVLATAPGIETDGRSLSSILSWVERETGRRVRYSDPEVAALAEATTVSGSAAGFTPVETLETVLMGSLLRHRLENGSILIER